MSEFLKTIGILLQVGNQVNEMAISNGLRQCVDFTSIQLESWPDVLGSTPGLTIKQITNILTLLFPREKGTEATMTVEFDIYSNNDANIDYCARCYQGVLPGRKKQSLVKVMPTDFPFHRGGRAIQTYKDMHGFTCDGCGQKFPIKKGYAAEEKEEDDDDLYGASMTLMSNWSSGVEREAPRTRMANWSSGVQGSSGGFRKF